MGWPLWWSSFWCLHWKGRFGSFVPTCSKHQVHAPRYWRENGYLSSDGSATRKSDRWITQALRRYEIRDTKGSTLSGFSISDLKMIKVDEYRQPFLFALVTRDPQLARPSLLGMTILFAIRVKKYLVFTCYRGRTTFGLLSSALLMRQQWPF